MLRQLKGMLSWAAMVMALAGGTALAAQGDSPWALVMPPQPTDHPDKIVVYELFWYACPHCAGILPYMEKWKKNLPADVVVEEMPAAFSDGRQHHFTKAFYALEALGVLSKLHPMLFHEYHVNHNRMDSLDTLADYLGTQGVDKEEFKKAYNSFGVDMKLRRAMKITKDFAISGVPALVVNGKYRLLSEKINGYDAMFGVVDQLVEMERQAMKAQTVPAVPTDSPADASK